MIAAVNHTRGGKVTLEGQLRQLCHFRWDFVGNDGDDAAAPERDERERDGVVTGEDDEVFRDGVQNRGHLGDVARSFFDATMVSISASRFTVAVSMLTPVRPCTL